MTGPGGEVFPRLGGLVSGQCWPVDRRVVFGVGRGDELAQLGVVQSELLEGLGAQRG